MQDEVFLEIYNNVGKYPTTNAVSIEVGMSESGVRRRANRLRREGFGVADRSKINRPNAPAQVEAAIEDLDEEVVTENVRLAKNHQRAMDKNRIQNKSFREYARVENAVSELNDKLVTLLEKESVTVSTKKHPTKKAGAVGIVHFSDLHLNEQIDLPCNQFNFEIASQRIRKHVLRAKHYFASQGISDIMVCFTSDILNSDRRLDELLINATNRSHAIFIAVDILQQAICELNEDFNVTVASVTGNESRVGKDVGWIKAVAQDNYDFVIHNMLALLFKDKEGVTFIDCSDAPLERVVNVMGSNVLMIHGHNGLAANPSKKVALKRSQYAAQGIKIDYVIMGHIHEAMIADTYARSSGLPGANAYSENALNLTSRSSQNLYIFYDDQSHDCIKVDLQNVDNVQGYDYSKALEAYNTKSDRKGQDGKVIVQVVI